MTSICFWHFLCDKKHFMCNHIHKQIITKVGSWGMLNRMKLLATKTIADICKTEKRLIHVIFSREPVVYIV